MKLKGNRIYLVIDVGDVHDEIYIEVKVVHHDAPDDVRGDIVPCVAEMALVVDRRSAGIPRHLARVFGVKADRAAGLERVVDSQAVSRVGHSGGKAPISLKREMVKTN